MNRHVVPTAAFQFNRDAAPGSEALYTALRERMGEHAVFSTDASALARALLGDDIGANLFLVGVAAQRGFLPVSTEAIQQAVRLNGAAVDLNLRALALGRLFAVDPSAVEAQMPKARSRRPASVNETMQRSVRHLEAYQDADYASRYLKRVLAVRDGERLVLGTGEQLADAVARNYAKLLAYKDEYEVARLLSDASLQSELRERFPNPRAISFNLAPPILSRTGSDGRPEKIRVPAYLAMAAFGTLRKLKGLRGTPFDVFGYSVERRAERALIAEYEAAIDLVLDQLTPANHEAAVKLLSLPDEIRGFGPVKHAALQRYKKSRDVAQGEFLERTVSSDADS